LWWWKTKHIRGHLWHRYSAMVNQVTVATVKLSKWWLQFKRARRGRDRCLSPLVLSVQILVRTRCTHYVIKFVSNFRQVGAFLWFPPPIKLAAITEILLKAALNIIKPIKPNNQRLELWFINVSYFYPPSHSFLSAKTNSSIIILENCILIW
jgi:hypothetical protein